MTKRLFLALLAVCGLSYGVQLLLYPQLPNLVPTNWGINGQISTWGSKRFCLLFGALPLAFVLLLQVVPLLDPRRQHYKRHQKAYNSFGVILIVLVLGISWFTILAAFRVRLPFMRLIVVLVGITLLVQGNYMPQIRSNFFWGVRTPWALSSELVWRKTNRLAGILFAGWGLLFVASAFLPLQWAIWVALCPVFIVVGVPCLYSYILYRKITKEDPPHAKN